MHERHKSIIIEICAWFLALAFIFGCLWLGALFVMRYA
jgi:hypothetical protein